MNDEDGDSIADLGESIAYTFVVTNTGNVTLTDVTVVDDRIAALIPASVDVLAPAATFTFAAEDYIVTAEDVTAGEIVNVATATGITPSGEVVESTEDTATVNSTQPSTPPDPPTTPTPAPAPGGGGGLANTGADSWPIVLTTMLLLITGGALLLHSRRRQLPTD